MRSSARVTSPFTETEIAKAISDTKEAGSLPIPIPSTKITRVIARRLLGENVPHNARTGYLRTIVMCCTKARHFDDEVLGLYINIARRLLQNRQAARRSSTSSLMSRSRLHLPFTGAHTA